jgi:hypothetical protein
MGSEIKDTIYSMGFRLEKHLLTQRIEEKKELYQELDQVLKQEFTTPKTVISSQSLDERPANQQSPQGLLSMEPPSFNNQMESNTGVSPASNAIQYPLNPWGMLPMMNYPHPGLFYWYA